MARVIRLRGFVDPLGRLLEPLSVPIGSDASQTDAADATRDAGSGTELPDVSYRGDSGPGDGATRHAGHAAARTER